jgi:hypothetical protein
MKATGTALILLSLLTFQRSEASADCTESQKFCSQMGQVTEQLQGVRDELAALVPKVRQLDPAKSNVHVRKLAADKIKAVTEAIVKEIRQTPMTELTDEKHEARIQKLNEFREKIVETEREIDSLAKNPAAPQGAPAQAPAATPDLTQRSPASEQPVSPKENRE